MPDAYNITYDRSMVVLIRDDATFDHCVFDDCVIVGSGFTRVSITNCEFNGRAGEWYRRELPLRKF